MGRDPNKRGYNILGAANVVEKNLKQISSLKSGVSSTDWLKTFEKAVRSSAKISNGLRSDKWDTKKILTDVNNDINMHHT